MLDLVVSADFQTRRLRKNLIPPINVNLGRFRMELSPHLFVKLTFNVNEFSFMSNMSFGVDS